MDDGFAKSWILSIVSFKVLHRADAFVMGAPGEGIASSLVGLDLQITSVSYFCISALDLVERFSHLCMEEFGYGLQFVAVVNGARFVCIFLISLTARRCTSPFSVIDFSKYTVPKAPVPRLLSLAHHSSFLTFRWREVAPDI